MLSLAVHNPNNPALAKLKEELAAREFQGAGEFLVSKKTRERVFARPTPHPLILCRIQKRTVFLVAPGTLADCLGTSTTRAALSKERLKPATARNTRSTASRSHHGDPLRESAFALPRLRYSF